MILFYSVDIIKAECVFLVALLQTLKSDWLIKCDEIVIMALGGPKTKYIITQKMEIANNGRHCWSKQQLT